MVPPCKDAVCGLSWLLLDFDFSSDARIARVVSGLPTRDCSLLEAVGGWPLGAARADFSKWIGWLVVCTMILLSFKPSDERFGRAKAADSHHWPPWRSACKNQARASLVEHTFDETLDWTMLCTMYCT